ncbi:hypothetical protein, partial [uncultured Flavobacterium sp.]|uniref:hypothetical protein n=1 Tax=uncultured Flavobacterium sp. TaxID=165435 RepID=UPI0025EF1E61
MRKITFIIILLFSISTLKAQDYTFRKNINKDSLFDVSVKKLPQNMREEYTKEYKNGNEQSKEFLLFMISMPESSKKQLITNFENKKNEIENLKKEYSKLVPKNHLVEIEFESESKILNVPEQIKIKIYKNNSNTEKSKDKSLVQRNDNLELVSQNWNIKPNSKELNEILKTLNWTNQTLTQIKTLLKEANCISIENGKITTIGFARSGMGLYSYKIFETILNSKQKTEYNNGCEY